MDAYEATKIVLSRIQNLDPENASKIMGILLIQDHGEKEMIRLAFGPEALLHSVVLKVKKDMGFNSPSSPSSPLPFRPLSRQSSCFSGGSNLPSPLSIPSQSTSSWANSCFSDFQDDIFSPNSSSFSSNLASSSSMNSSASPFYAGAGVSDLSDETHLQEQLSFLNEGLGSPNLGPKSPDFYYPNQDFPSGAGAGFYGGPSSNSNWVHRRSCSVSDICLGSDPVSDPSCGFGWKPCLYYARGYCKNGNSCKFLHAGDSAVAGDGVGSPGKMEMMDHQCQELLRSKSAHQQRMAQLMASSNFPFSPTSANKCMNLLLQQQQSDTQRAAAAMMLGEDLQKFGRSRLERGDFNGCLGMMNPGSRQIYLTFPADSTFREEDVSNYFSIFGPVQDVRIPYQQKRMFGFVTFVYPETVKLILAKGNPHFVCDARVLVKPYKEKGKVPEKYRKQHGDFTSCGSPTGLDSRDPFDLQLGARMFCNSQDMWRKKLEEQADLQQAIELQSRRLMSLQLLDVKRHSHHRTLSSGAAPHSPNFFTQTMSPLSNRSSPEIFEENGPIPSMGSLGTIGGDKKSQFSVNEGEKVKEIKENGSSNGNGSDKSSNGKESPDQNSDNDLLESLEHNLPDSPFASPKAAGNYFTAFSAPESDKNSSVVSAPANNNLISSSLDMASLKSCYFQSPRLSSGHGAIGM